jgi:DNA-binding beta-propeller fold protein YncE
MPSSEVLDNLVRIDIPVSTIRTVAGNGTAGLFGEGGPATAAGLNEPKGISLDGQGNLLIADSENHVIRRVDRASGIILTIAGCPLISEQGVTRAEVTATTGEDPFSEGTRTAERAFAQQADLSGTVRYVVNEAGMSKRFGGDGGPAIHALLNFPTAITVDQAGHLYIADTMNHRIRRIDAATGVISTLAGLGHPRFSGDGGPAGKAGLNEPAAVVVHGDRLYVADQSNNRVRVIDLITQTIATVAGTGSAVYNGDGMPALEASLAGPSGLAVAADGTLYIADTFNGRIRAVDPVTGTISTIVGDGGEYRYQGPTEASSTSLSRPSGIAVDREGNLLITDSDNHLVRRWERASGRIDRVAGIGEAHGTGDGGPALEASLSYPFGILVDRSGHVLVADTFNHRIRQITLSP